MSPSGRWQFVIPCTQHRGRVRSERFSQSPECSPPLTGLSSLSSGLGSSPGHIAPACRNHAPGAGQIDVRRCPDHSPVLSRSCSGGLRPSDSVPLSCRGGLRPSDSVALSCRLHQYPGFNLIDLSTYYHLPSPAPVTPSIQSTNPNLPKASPQPRRLSSLMGCLPPRNSLGDSRHLFLEINPPEVHVPCRLHSDP